MAKFKPSKGKSKSRAATPGGLPCVILIAAGIVLMLLFVYFVITHAN